jgi:hypothetical protein
MDYAGAMSLEMVQDCCKVCHPADHTCPFLWRFARPIKSLKNATYKEGVAFCTAGLRHQLDCGAEGERGHSSPEHRDADRGRRHHHRAGRLLGPGRAAVPVSTYACLLRV